MNRTFNVAAATVFLLVISQLSLANSTWNSEYFPNTDLITHDGKKVKFFDDLIKGKIVSVNFIYTSCPDVCPLETAQLVRVQHILGDRMGKDVHFYSITIDPENDTPEALREYRSRFKANWTFLTGDKEEIRNLRRKLGLYIEGVEEGGNQLNHNVSMIVGNQKTGRWMKRSPFENPHVLADQLGNWLDGWHSKQTGPSYDEAPELRSVTTGETLFRTRCGTCHSMRGAQEENDIGPDLIGVTKRREKAWLGRWMQFPDKMIEEKDPIAIAMLKQYNNLPMPNLRLNALEINDLLDYFKESDTRHTKATRQKVLDDAFSQSKIKKAKQVSKAKAKKDVVAIMNAWVREAYPGATVNAGYMTLINTGKESVELVSARSSAFEKVEFHEMSMDGGMMEMRELNSVVIAPGKPFVFETGGKHLMLKQPAKRLVDGDTIDIDLNFKSGAIQTLTIKVIKE